MRDVTKKGERREERKPCSKESRGSKTIPGFYVGEYASSALNRLNSVSIIKDNLMDQATVNPHALNSRQEPQPPTSQPSLSQPTSFSNPSVFRPSNPPTNNPPHSSVSTPPSAQNKQSMLPRS